MFSVLKIQRHFLNVQQCVSLRSKAGGRLGSAKKRKVQLPSFQPAVKSSNEGHNPLSTRLKHLILPTVLTGACCLTIEAYSRDFCHYIFPYRSRREFEEFFARTRRQKNPLSEWWIGLPNVCKLAYGIVFVHGCVFVAFRLFPSFVGNVFSAGPKSSVLGIPLAMFSHFNGLHLLINSTILISWSKGCSRSLQDHQFLILYLEIGIVTTFLVVAWKILSNSYAYRCVGASGAICGLMGFVSQENPEAEFGPIGLMQVFPGLVFKNAHLPAAIIVVEGILLLARVTKLMPWNPISHEAHILGMLLGVLFYRTNFLQHFD